MAPYSPPPRDDDVTAWDARRGVFLVADPTRPPPHPRRARAWEIALLLAGLAVWCAVFLPGAIIMLRDWLR